MKTTNIRKSISRIFIFAITASSALLFTAFSPWEGAAAVAPAGELPARGFFVATNSFPMNTVVDITNIESGKSTRVIVAATLNSPGLLAIVSHEAADLIDMRAGSVSRVRMIQPSDPMAYMRFTESMAIGTPMFRDEGIPNEERNILEERLLEEHYSEDTYIPPAAQQPIIAEQEPAVPEVIAQRGYIVDEPEWGGSGRLNIVDIPGFYIDPVENFPLHVTEPEPITIVQKEEPRFEDEPVNEEPVYEEPIYEEPVYVVEEEPVINDEPVNIEPEPEYIAKEPIYVEPEPEYVAEEPYEDPYVEETPWYVEEKIEIVEKHPTSDSKNFVKDVSDRIDEKSKDDIIKDTPVYYTHNDKNEINKDIPTYYMADGSRSEIIKDTPVWTEAEEKIAQAPIEEPVKTLVPVEAEERLPPSTVYDIPLTDIIPEIVQVPPAKEPELPVRQPVAPPVAAQPSPSFSARTISHLDSGRYYVQLAALADDNVDNAVRQIDRRYDPVVYKDIDNLNRILIGPLNQGESAAILQRFKTIGYKDAFVRRGN